MYKQQNDDEDVNKGETNGERRGAYNSMKEMKRKHQKANIIDRTERTYVRPNATIGLQKYRTTFFTHHILLLCRQTHTHARR